MPRRRARINARGPLDRPPLWQVLLLAAAPPAAALAVIAAYLSQG